jgi:thiol-disulfide isomerase/thioredoxin
MILYPRALVQAASFLFLCLFASAAWGTPSTGVSVEETYPELAGGTLRKARLEKLPKGVVLQTKEIQIAEKLLQKTVQKADPEQRSQYEKNLFFILEQEVVNEIILNEARRVGAKPDSSDEEIIQKYLDEKASGVNVTPQEAEEFYKQNKDSFGGVSFENVKDDVQRYLYQQKKDEAIRSYKRSVGEGWDILVDAEWTEKQNLLSKDNFVDKARLSGKPTIVEFGATGCGPCDMMQPILENLKRKYKDRLNVVFVHVGEEKILGARYGIKSIPVQAFFDKAGREMFRHTGFYPQVEVEKRLAEMGVQ